MKARSLLAVAAAAALAAPAAAVPVQIIRGIQDSGLMPSVGGWSGRGKGKGKRPHHRSSRFVAQDKRDARKRRNRSRSLGTGL